VRVSFRAADKAGFGGL